MRKLEARLEKVADEKWSEDPATEDEEAAVGLSPYTRSLMNPPSLTQLSLPVLGKHHVPPWEQPLPSVFCLLPS